MYIDLKGVDGSSASCDASGFLFFHTSVILNQAALHSVVLVLGFIFSILLSLVSILQFLVVVLQSGLCAAPITKKRVIRTVSACVPKSAAYCKASISKSMAF